jgi:hypothetical protein
VAANYGRELARIKFVIIGGKAFKLLPAMEASFMKKGRCNPVFLLLLVLTIGLGFAASVGPSAKPPAKSEPANVSGDSAQNWKQFDLLAKQQKFQAASSLVEKMLAEARARKDNTEWTRGVIGMRFAALEAGSAQVVYLIFFSYAHFLEGYTGLIVTIGSILTLFVIMQLTSRIRWSEKFKSEPRAANKPVPPLVK